MAGTSDVMFGDSPEPLQNKKACSGCQSPGNGACPPGQCRTRSGPGPHRPIDIDRTPFMTETRRVNGALKVHGAPKGAWHLDGNGKAETVVWIGVTAERVPDSLTVAARLLTRQGVILK